MEIVAQTCLRIMPHSYFSVIFAPAFVNGTVATDFTL
jgi:hypothetical protein